jgi:hypothetical protein
MGVCEGKGRRNWGAETVEREGSLGRQEDARAFKFLFDVLERELRR